jgi:hypothetical protein
MRPIFVILYAVIVTLLLTVFYPRLRVANPRVLWFSAGAGLAVLLVIIVLAFAR